jgi:transcription elongation GreA/GreB family factor
MRTKLKKLERVLLDKIERAEKVARKTKKDAQELAHTAISSHSTAGERNLAEGQAAINEENLLKLKKLLHEINKSLEASAIKVEPISWVEISYKNGETNSFYFVQEPAHLDNITLVSVKSPLGSVLVGKKAGESIKFQSKEVSIKVVE